MTEIALKNVTVYALQEREALTGVHLQNVVGSLNVIVLKPIMGKDARYMVGYNETGKPIEVSFYLNTAETEWGTTCLAALASLSQDDDPSLSFKQIRKAVDVVSQMVAGEQVEDYSVFDSGWNITVCLENDEYAKTLNDSRFKVQHEA